jgi:hypothetical protein
VLSLSIAAPPLTYVTMRRQILGKLVELAVKIDLGDRNDGPKLLYDLREAVGFGSMSHTRLLRKIAGRKKPSSLLELSPLMTRVISKANAHALRSGLPSFLPRKFERTGCNVTLLDDRRRNDMGQYAANETEGIDPNSMAAAYGPPAVQPVNPMSESHLDRIKRFFGKRRDAGAAPVVGS